MLMLLPTFFLIREQEILILEELMLHSTDVLALVACTITVSSLGCCTVG